jgi:phosphonate transport system substrate-binding protein
VSGGPLLLGAVAYDPKVVTIWEGFRAWLGQRGLDFDYVLYSNYERQVEAHLAGDVHVTWSSPLSWLETACAAGRSGRAARAFLMRDTDRDLTSVIVVRRDSRLASLADLRGRRVGVGAADSPQATLIPLLHLAEAGLEPGRDVEVVRHDVLVGKHGDHVGGERDAARALASGAVDAACFIDGNHLQFAREGTLPQGSTSVLAQTPPYDHCVMASLGDVSPDVERFTELLLSMSYDDAEVRPLLELEGLKRWMPGRTTGFGQLTRAVDRFGTIDAFVEIFSP